MGEVKEHIEQCKQRDGHFKKEMSEIKIEKHCSRNAFDGLISRLDMAE